MFSFTHPGDSLRPPLVGRIYSTSWSRPSAPHCAPPRPPNLQEVSATEAFLSGHDTLRDFQEMKTLKKKKVNFSKH